MNFSRGRSHRKLAEISVVPLIDLFLNILVFFLVTTSFGSHTVFFVDLPKTHAADSLKNQNQVMIAIHASGELAVNNKKTTLINLRSQLEEIGQDKRASFPVIIRADKKAYHGAVVSALDVVRDAGFKNVGMATQVQLGEGSQPN